VELPILSRALGQSARWVRVNSKGHVIRMDPPKEVVEQIAGMIEKWPFPPLAGVIGTPSLRPDGSLLATEGYDPQTGFVLLSPPIMPPVPERPSPANAASAIALLAELLTEFPFQNAASRSVAMSMLITPVIRAALPPAVPLHVVTAPESGTGKSYLLDIASAIAVGDRCAVMALSKPEETEKRLIGAALAGHPIIALDNCSTLLLGDFLCQVAERPLLQLRPLGTSKDVRVANTFTVYADGNNLTVGADVVRRTLQCALDANMEEPSDRQFVNNPVDTILSRRGDYIAACLTIARAYIAAGLPGRLPPVPSFEKWSDLVRSPLVWLGYPDPAETTKTVRNEDPIRQARAAFFSAWATEIGCLHSYRTADLVTLADTRPDWLEALLAIARASTGSARVDTTKLGHWLRDNANAIAASFKLHVDRSDKQRPKWQLQPIKKG
jgi:putative DNA primase/helicase